MTAKPIEIKTDVAISKLTTFQNAGAISELQIFSNVEDLQQFVKQTPEFFVIGKGSNSLINPNSDTRKWIQLSPDFGGHLVTNNQVRVGAGKPLNQLLKTTTEAGLSGLEFSAGVPCGVGGMIAMNFGCWGKEIAEVVNRVKILTRAGKIEWLSRDDLNFTYRNSDVQTHNWVVLEVEFNLVPGEPQKIKQLIRKNIQKRLSHQPLRGRTFGSVFKNPPNHYAGKLLEGIGVKGIVVNNMKFSEQHANFLVNLGQAEFNDTINYLEEIQRRVQLSTGMALELEVKVFK